VHFRPDAASAVISALVSPDRTAKIFRSPQGLVSGRRTCGDGLPRLGVFAGSDDGMRTAIGDGVAAFTRTAGAVCSDAGDFLFD
jgi:hypothetical protein